MEGMYPREVARAMRLAQGIARQLEATGREGRGGKKTHRGWMDVPAAAPSKNESMLVIFQSAERYKLGRIGPTEPPLAWTLPQEEAWEVS